MENSRNSLFNSILDLQESPHKERPRPPFFQDLNLDRIIDRICLDWGENVAGLFYYLPANASCEDYRREVYGDMSLEGVYEALCAFSERMKARREVFVKKEEVSHRLQKAIWHIREADEYCMAYGELYTSLEKAPFKSRGMLSFRAYLKRYLEEPAFREMRQEARRLMEELSTFRLVVTYENDRISVAQGQVEGAYDAFLDKTFPEQSRRMKSPFETVPELVELEQELLKVFQKKSPDFFRSAEAFLEKYEVYGEETLLRFSSEIGYYLSFYCFERKMRERGYAFCTPVMQEGQKEKPPRESGGTETVDERACGSGEDSRNMEIPEMYARGLYDLALACAHTGGQSYGQEIVSNDMEYRPGERFFVLTGPNQGGKTTFARSLGQMVFLAKMGLKVPADSAGMYRFPGLMTHFSVEESVETGRGKLMDELLRLAPMMDGACGGNFVVINELFTTAANYDACIMGKRVLEHFLKQGCMGIYVTHLAELSETCDGVVSLRAMVDSQGVRSYKIARGRAADYANAATQVRKYGLTYEQLKERLAGRGY